MRGTKEILKTHGLKVTQNRVDILEIFQSSNYALSYNDLDAQLKSKLDKVTVYRTLKSFEKTGILHEVLDGGSQVKYALECKNGCNHEENHEAHAHFKCDSCEKTFCLETVTIPNLKVPKGFQVEKRHVSFQGLCESCR